MFEENRYSIVRNFLSSEMCTLLFDYVNVRKDANTMLRGDSRVPDAPRLYGDPLTETLLVQRHAAIEGVVGELLWPSYSYVRMCGRGSTVPIHTDREASEIGVTIAIGGDREWPLCLRTAAGDVSITMQHGDALVYDGRRVPHWREPYGGDLQVQAMLFYVRQRGEYAAFRYDGREGVGRPRRSMTAAQACATAPTTA